MNFHYGVVENRDDPLKLGRCQVRIVGLHTHDKSQLPTADLPWATPMQPVTSAAMNGIGWSPVGPVEGTTVIVTFADDAKQQPIMLGTVGGIPQSKSAALATEDSGNIITDGGTVSTPDGQPLKNEDGSEVTLGNMVEGKDKVITGVNSAINKIKNQAAALIGSVLGVNLDIFGNSTLGKAKVETLTLPVKGADDEKAETVIPKVVPKEEAKITAQPEPGKADSKVLSTAINLEPMPKYCVRGKEGVAKESIAALIEACDKVGLTSKYAKAAILGICGGESAWLPVEEGHVYSKASFLLNTFPSIFKGDEELANQYTSGKKSKSEFFELIYGYKFPKGQGLGNKLPGDGGKYYGRGFNQLTGKSGYQQAQDELKKLGITVDLINKPESLIDDIKTAALACAIYYKVNVKHPQDDPGYFVKARARTGADAHGGYAKKQIIYEYYLGQSVLTESTNKTSTDDVRGKTYTPEEVSYLPAEKQKALLEDRSENTTVGFKDPNGKYPLRNLINEPDTNRLSRGIIQDTSIAYKDQIRTTGIPAPFGSVWEQPLAPFGGKYPYSKVYETESGHVQMFDDTSGHETLSLYHRKGTFLDIDANGTQVNKIVGDGYTIYDRNGLIYVQGKCNLTVGNSVNIMVVGDANIEVNGQVQAMFHSGADIGVAKDVTMAIGGDFSLNVGGNFSTNVGGNKTTTVGGNSADQITGNITSKAGGYIAHETAGEYTALAAAAMKITGSVQHIKATGGNVNVDGTEFHGQEGAAANAESVATITNTDATDLVAPSYVEGKANSFEILQTPVRPAPPADIKLSLLDDYEKAAANVDYANIPPAAIEGGVGAAAVKPQPTTSEDPPSMMAQNTATGDLYGFIQKQYTLALEGYWSEKAMKTGLIEDSNPNIIAMWKDIGLFNILKNVVKNSKGEITSGGDQTAWCMAFVTWSLKQNGYKWCQVATAKSITDNPSKFGCVKVTEPRNGDIIHVKFGNGNHVAFVSDVTPAGKFSMLGGNQGGSGGGNNPSAGSVTKSYKGVMSASGYKGVEVVGIYRPSKEV